MDWIRDTYDSTGEIANHAEYVEWKMQVDQEARAYWHEQNPQYAPVASEPVVGHEGSMMLLYMAIGFVLMILVMGAAGSGKKG